MAKEEGHSAEKDAFAFSRLRPACVELLKEPCVRSVEGLYMCLCCMCVCVCVSYGSKLSISATRPTRLQ